MANNSLKTDIVIDLKGDLSRKAKTYGQEMTKLGSRSKAAFTMINTSAMAASRGIDKFGNRAILGAGAVAVAFERTFVKTAAEFERYQVMLNQLQGSEEGGARAMKWIEDFTQNTPYAVNEVTQAFVKLKTFGIDPMDGSMQAIVDSTAMMGGTAETVDGIATAIGQAMTKGKLQAEEINQLLERGIPVYEYLQKISKDLGHNSGLGKTVAQIQADASAGMLGKQTVELLIEEMGRQAQGAAKAQMDTWSGMVSNMGDHWKLFQKDVMESGTFDVLKDELGGFLAQLDEMKETGEYDEFVEKVGKDLVDGFRAAAEAAREIKEAGQEIMPVIRQVTNMTAALIDAVGGYGNLAKIMASIYAVNKAIRISSPLLKVSGAAGGFVLDKVFGGKGKKGAASAANALGATPVYVVNMPVGGFGGDLVSPVKGNTVTKATTTAGKAVNAAKVVAGTVIPTYLAYEASSAGASVIDDMLGNNIDGYRELDAKFTTKIKAFFGNKEAQAQDVDFYGADPNKYRPKEITPPAYMMGTYGTSLNTPYNPYLPAQSLATKESKAYSQSGEMKLKVEVSDDRVKVKAEQLPMGFTVDPDTGIN
ncbi:tape measure protein [Vibrio mytili]|uniref:tape measure protein n=1 Tax=Vibrio mytili TaxID=50718 RepID=UPI002F40DBD8